MVWSWFDANESKKFAEQLAESFMEKDAQEQPDSKKKSVLKKQKLLNMVFQDVNAFKQQHKPNLYKKAQFANTFKWALKEAGYEDAYVDEFVREIMLRL
jgi:protoporphyrinogen oxidase